VTRTGLVDIRDRDLVAGLRREHDRRDRRRRGDGLAVECRDHIAHGEACGGGRPTGHDAGYQGIADKSRFSDAFDCWAIFEGAAFERVGTIAAVSPDDPDLQAAAALFGLAV